MTAETEHPTPDQLAAFDSGTLPGALRDRVERHVAACAACCRLLERLPEDDLAARLRDFSTSGVPPELRDHPRIDVVAPIGSGGMGTVYRAVQKQLGRPVAVKVLHHRLTGHAGFATRFAGEVRALARLNHPHIVQAFDADRAGDSHFLVMELVDGESLEARVRRGGPLPPPEACGLVRQAALGLGHAHGHGLVHRDVKPGNLLLTRDGILKVADFGLARLAGPDGPVTPESAPPVVGTPEYMAPEQARDPDRADARADLYALGCTLYFLLSGRPPFTGPSPLQVLLAHQDAAVPPLPGIPRAVDSILRRLLAKDPAARFATADELIVALDRTAAPDAAPPASRRGWWAAGAVALVAAGTAAILALGPRDPVVFAPTPPPASPVGPGEPVARAPELAPPPRAVDRMALATPGQLRARRHESAGRLVEWVRANNRWKPDADIAVKTAAMVEEAIPRADAFTAAFGGALTRSGKPTLVTCRTGGFFVFELTPAQARGADLNAGRNWFVSCSYPADPRRAVPRVVVSDLRLDGGGELAPGSRLDGSVACEFPEAPEPGSYLRITHHMPDGRRVMFLHHPRETPPAGRVVMRFSANPLEPRPGRGDQLVPVFADWVSPGDVVESDAAAALALVRDDR